MQIIESAAGEGRTLLSEFESACFLESRRIPVARHALIMRREDLEDAAAQIGYPLVLKGCAPGLSHKSERTLVRVGLRDGREAADAFSEISGRMKADGLEGAGVLVQELVTGSRELVIGMVRDAQFGPCVMFGLGGIFTEILSDVAFRAAPLEQADAMELMQEIRGAGILGAFRGMPPADLDMLASILVRTGEIGLENPAVKSIDINPLILSDGGRPVAVDALVELAPPTG